MSESRLHGRPASPGLAIGKIAHVPSGPAASRVAGTPEQERTALHAAIAAASGEVEALAARSAGDGADILSFQVALLGDEALYEPALAAIADGAPADAAWRTALDHEIAGYTGADDPHFRARTADLADLRDRVLALLAGSTLAIDTPPGAVLVADDLTPSRFLATDWTHGGAIALTGGSPTSHVAVLARARGVPMVVGLGVLPGALPRPGAEALVDGSSGRVVLDPSSAARAAFAQRMAAAAAEAALQERMRFAPARMADGTTVRILVNVGDPADLAACDPAMCDGVGLVRTEFLFRAGRPLPDEGKQLAAYRRILDWAAGRPVTFRTLDAGGDKPIAGLTIDGEANPFLGQRGIRLSLARPEVFRVQLRALARAAAHGAVKVMLPMVTVPGELRRAAEMLDEEVAALAAAGIPARRPPLGIMVEVPAAALSAAQFDAAFYSIGSNDLVQYTLAAARDGGVADLADAANPAVLELIARTVRAGLSSGAEVSLCGDAAAEPALVSKLLATGLRTLSVAPVAVARVKAAVAACDPRAEA